MNNKNTPTNSKPISNKIAVLIALVIICGFLGIWIAISGGIEIGNPAIQTTPRETTTLYADQRVIEAMRWKNTYQNDIPLGGYSDLVLTANADIMKGSFIMPDEVEIFVDHPERVRVEFLSAKDNFSSTDLYFRVYGLEEGSCEITAFSKLGDSCECTLEVDVTSNKKPEDPPETTESVEHKDPKITEIRNSGTLDSTTLRMDRYLDGQIAIYSEFQPALEDIRLVVSDPNVADAYFNEIFDRNQSSVTLVYYRIRPHSPGTCTIYVESADGKFATEKIEITVIDPSVPPETTSVTDITSSIETTSTTEPTLSTETTSVTETTRIPETTTYQEPVSATEAIKTYTLNTNTKKFHNPSCSYANRISGANKSSYTGTISALISQGYEPCGHCYP